MPTQEAEIVPALPIVPESRPATAGRRPEASTSGPQLERRTPRETPPPPPPPPNLRPGQAQGDSSAGRERPSLQQDLEEGEGRNQSQPDIILPSADHYGARHCAGLLPEPTIAIFVEGIVISRATLQSLLEKTAHQNTFCPKSISHFAWRALDFVTVER